GWQRIGAGTWQSSEVRFSEVGVARLQADLVGDGLYLGSGTIPGNRSSAPIGRFIPAYFAVSSKTELQVAPAQDDFTYFGQVTSFATAPELQLQPRGAQDGNLQNYVAEFMRLKAD